MYTNFNLMLKNWRGPEAVITLVGI